MQGPPGSAHALKLEVLYRALHEFHQDLTLPCTEVTEEVLIVGVSRGGQLGHQRIARCKERQTLIPRAAVGERPDDQGVHFRP